MNLEQQIKDAGADVAPRATPADIEANIASEFYFTAREGALANVLKALADSGGASATPEHVAALTEVHKKISAASEALGLLTFCVLVLKNGFTVTGESACASPENFNAEIGRKVARDNAVEKVWPLLGFRLKDRLAAAAIIGFDPRRDPL